MVAGDAAGAGLRDDEGLVRPVGRHPRRLRLPKVDGYQVCQTLKGNPITSSIPIIMITALNATPQKVKGIEYGADDYISKPFDLDELLARIKMIMRRVGAAAT